jgi:hypothetical protein
LHAQGSEHVVGFQAHKSALLDDLCGRAGGVSAVQTTEPAVMLNSPRTDFIAVDLPAIGGLM